MKKHVRFAISLALLLGALMATVYAVEPRYIGLTRLSSSLTISTTGQAVCTGRAYVRNGYTADVKVELKEDGTTIMTWTNSGSNTVSAGGTYGVQSGHNYMVTTTATVYGSNGKVIEMPFEDSDGKYY